MAAPVFKTPDSGFYFFGYYDKSPLNAVSNKLLALRSTFIHRMAEFGDSLEIGFFDFPCGSRFEAITETRAWNWQQGCMLQWLGPTFDEEIAFNDVQDGRFVTVIRNVYSGRERVLPHAVYTIDRSAKFALCIDFERHYWVRRGYGYDGVKNILKAGAVGSGDGIWRLDLDTGHREQIVEIAKLIATQPLANMRGATHYLEHLMLSPSGQRFCFLHRWTLPDGGIYSRFYTANVDGTGIFLLHDSGRISHFCWHGDEELLAYCGLPTAASKLRKNPSIARGLIRPLLPLFHRLVRDETPASRIFTGDGYVLMRDQTDQKRKLRAAFLGRDGHPTFSPIDSTVFVTDTYPSKKHVRTLRLVNLSSLTDRVIAELDSDPTLDGTGMRADLHPKWSFDGRWIAVDTTHGGGRSIFVYEA